MRFVLVLVLVIVIVLVLVLVLVLDFPLLRALRAPIIYREFAL
jgi:hypothetical protein